MRELHGLRSRGTGLGQRGRYAGGTAMVEFTIVGPLVMLIGLAILNYGLLFLAKSQLNHATFMAARAASTGHADIDVARTTFRRALIPLYGGGVDNNELAATYNKILADEADGQLDLRILNPTIESFDDWNDPVLEANYGARAIRNTGLASRDPAVIGANSGQNIQDANIVKIRAGIGYRQIVPFVDRIYSLYLQWMDPGTDPFHTSVIASGRIPIVAVATVQMQSDPIEKGNPLSPGPGNGGTPVDPGNPPAGGNGAPPDCRSVGCTDLR